MTQPQADPDQTRSMLQRRARDVARRGATGRERRVLQSVIAVRRGDYVLGLPMAAVQEIRSVDMTVLPHATAVLQGLFHVRGIVHSLVDVYPILEPGKAIGARSSTIVAILLATGGAIGLRLDEVFGPREVFEDEADDASLEKGRGFVSHVTQDLLHVLDIPRLCAQPQMLMTARQ